MRITQSKIVSTADLIDGCVTNVKVNTAAAVVSTKLDLSAVAQVITPDADNTRDLGTSAKTIRTVYVGTSAVVAGKSVVPFAAQMGLLGGN